MRPFSLVVRTDGLASADLATGKIENSAQIRLPAKVEVPLRPTNMLGGIIMTENTESLWKELSEFAEEQRNENEVPGIAMGVSVGDEVFANGYGVTSLENPLDVNENTYFQIGSITKVFTCLLYTSPSPRDLSTSRMPSSA